jgi:virulence factor Mce-like protein
MKLRAIVIGALVAFVAVVAVIVTGSGSSDARTITLDLPNAYGLREGSQVRVGGVAVGKVEAIDLGPRDDVRIELKIERDKAEIGQGVKARIGSVNLLGEKFVDLDPGDTSRAAGDELAVPRNNVGVPTDLDQILDVFDADTRTRLAVLVNEASIALAGDSGKDLSATLREFPPSAETAIQLLDELTHQRGTLARLVGRSNRLIATVNQERSDLRRVIDAAGGAARTASERRAELRATLERAPSSLRALRGFLGDLERTTKPLGPAAREISRAAEPLRATLAEVAPFERASTPALQQATAAAPRLTDLGVKATPVVTRAVPTVDALASFSGNVRPLTNVLGTSIDDVLALMEGWARAIQLRDGLGHIFRGRAIVGTEALATVLEANVPKTKKTPPARRPQTSVGAAAPNSRSGAPTKTPKLPTLPEIKIPGLPPIKVPDVAGAVDNVLQGVNGSTRNTGSSSKGQPSSDLLDFLLGR